MSTRPKYGKSNKSNSNPIFLLIFIGLVICIIVPVIIPVIIVILIGITFFRSKILSSVKDDFGFLGDNEDFIRNILALAAYIAKADRKVSASEMAYVEKELKKDFKDNYAQQYFSIYKTYLKKEISVRRVAMRINADFDLPAKIQLLHFLVGIIAADGKLTPEEEHKIFTIARLLRVHSSFLRSIMATFGLRYSHRQEKKKTHQKNYQRKSFTSNLDAAYTILGISKTATDAQVKKAYRKLAKIHHPDRVIHLGEAYQMKAKEKFQKISDAYELIKERRGMV